MAQTQVTQEELNAAEAGLLKLVWPASIPPLANFYSWQRPWQPPLPFNLYWGLDVYELNEGRYLSDDRTIDYDLLNQGTGPMAAIDTGVENPMSAVEYGCKLWIAITRSTNGASNVVVTLHNTVGAGSYNLWSKEQLVATQSWTLETNLTGASGQDWTATTVEMNGRSNLFFIATTASFFTNKSFAGLQSTNSNTQNPDAMGAVGPDHFLQILNATVPSSAVAVFDRCSGERLEIANNTNFFAVQYQGTNYPSGQLADPRVLYDHDAKRWIACMFDTASKNVILAVSHSPSPTNLLLNWSKYLIPTARPGSGPGTDFPTLGVDKNGIYLTVKQIGFSNGKADSNVVVAIKKPDIYQGTNISVFKIVTTSELPADVIQPAVNFDNPPRGDYAWFVAKRNREGTNTYLGGALAYRRLQWSGTNADWADTSWITITDSSYRDYFDLDDADVRAPQPPGGAAIRLNQTGSRFLMAIIREGALWAAHHVGLSTNGSYVGTENGSNVTRTAGQWLKITTATNGDFLSITNGRVYDTNNVNPFWYYFPSLMVNKAGDMVMGFSGSRTNEFIGAYYSYRAADGNSPFQASLLRAGEGVFAPNRWGDYSFTSLDPVDELTFWTVQQYAANQLFDNIWGTSISEILPKF